jgi:hypothetical protein
MIMSILVLVSISLLAQQDSTKTAKAVKIARTIVPQGYLVSFEGDTKAPNYGWIGVSDTIMQGGKSQVQIGIDTIGADNSGHSLKITGSVIMGENPYVMFAGAATRFHDKERMNYDVSGFAGVHFWARGDGNTYRIELPTASITDYMYYSFPFTPPTDEWKEYKIPFKGFKQLPYGAKVPWTGTDVQGFDIMTVGGPTEKFTLNIDQIEFFGKAE